MPKDYGYFGKGSSGYAHYQQTFNSCFGSGSGGGGGHRPSNNNSGGGGFPAVPLPLPLGEVSPQVTERAHAVSPILKYQVQ